MPKTIFARKPVNLNQLKSDVADLKRLFNSQGDAYYVAEELQLSNQEWERLTEDFLADQPCFHQFSEKNLPATEEGTPCIRVTAPGSEIALIIDTQGYDYARYVGIEAAEDEEDNSEIEDDAEEWEEVTEDVVEEAIWGLLTGEWDTENCALEGCRVQNYENAGVMTYNKGLVVSLPNGSEFQLTIVQSR